VRERVVDGDERGTGDLQLDAQPVQVPDQHTGVAHVDGQPRHQPVPQVRHAAGGLQPVPGHVADGEHDPTVRHGLRVVPVAADLQGALRGQVPDHRRQARQPERPGRYRLDHVLQLPGEAVLGKRGHLPPAQLVAEPLDLGAPLLPRGHVLDQRVDLQRPAVRVPRRVRQDPQVLHGVAEPEADRDVRGRAAVHGLPGGLAQPAVLGQQRGPLLRARHRPQVRVPFEDAVHAGRPRGHAGHQVVLGPAQAPEQLRLLQPAAVLVQPLPPDEQAAQHRKHAHVELGDGDDPGPLLLVPEVRDVARHPGRPHLLVQPPQRAAHHARVELAEPGVHPAGPPTVDVPAVRAGRRDAEVDHAPVPGHDGQEPGAATGYDREDLPDDRHRGVAPHLVGHPSSVSVSIR
jgi:hypothetical protein